MTNMNIPSTPHFAGITFSSVHVPGDERSRTNPGHGYPAHDVETIEYEVFKNEQEMQAWVERKISYRQQFQVMRVVPLKVETKTSVKIADQP